MSEATPPPSERDQTVKTAFYSAVMENRHELPFFDAELDTVVERLRARVLDRLIGELGDTMADEVMAELEADAEETEAPPPAGLAAAELEAPAALEAPAPIPPEAVGLDQPDAAQ